MTRALLALLAACLAADVAHAACGASPTLCGLPVHSTYEQPRLEVAIDVVLVGDGFTSASDWAGVAANAIATIKAYTASGIYGSVPQLYNFHVVDVLSTSTDVGDTDTSDTALGMKVSGPFITAAHDRVATAALNAPDVDVVIAIANAGGGRANAYYPGQLASGGSVRLSRDMGPMAHELGHALIHLADEYEEASLCSALGETSLVSEPNITADATCTKFSHVAGAGCVQGGRYCSSGLYRSAVGCLMRTSGNAAACPVCAAEIRDTLLERRTGADRAAPWAATYGLTPSPVSGEARITAVVADHGFGPSRVSFALDGRHMATLETTPGFVGSASLPLDTRRLTDGAHVLEVFAEDGAGHSRRGAPVTFTTSNHVAPSGVVVTLHSPANGSTVQGWGYVSASVPTSAPVPALLWVELDGVPTFGARSSRSLSASWDATTLAPGSRTLRAVAMYGNGSLFNSGDVVVTLAAAPSGDGEGQGSGSDGDAGGGEGRPRVYLHAPAPWSAVGPLVPIEGALSGFADGPVELLLRLDEGSETPVTTITAGGQSGGSVNLVLDASAWSEGPHALQLVARSGASAASSDPVAVVRVAASEPQGFIRAMPAGAYVSGIVRVELVGHASPAVSALELRAGATLAGTVSGASGALDWDTRGVANACHTLSVTTRSTAGASASRDDRSRCVDNAAPVVAVTAPADGAVVGTGAVWIGCSASDVGSYVSSVDILVDGSFAFTAPANGGRVHRLAPGAHTVQARARDSAGNQTLSSIVRVTAADCAATGCDDGDACTTDTCAPDGCHHLPTPSCCRGAADCDDGNSCTTDSCDAGVCSSTPRAGCCNHGYDCRDGDPCTRDQCSGPGGTCSNPPGECCAQASDCDDAWSCTTDACLLGPGGACANDRAGECCRSDVDCDDGDACTTDVCGGGTCAHARTAGCCETATDCDDGQPCTFDYCDASRTCRASPIPNCCTGDADCDSLDPCASGTCETTKRTCTITRADGCCTFGFECGDGDPCTRDTCSATACGHSTTAVCCVIDEECEDGDPCTTGTCEAGGACAQAAIAGCCASDGDCDDGDPCTAERCEDGNTCTSEVLAACCAADDECDDGNPCTTNTCLDNACIYSPITACCTDASECNDADPCTTDACDAGTCRHHDVAGCCSDPQGCDPPPEEGASVGEDPLPASADDTTRIAGGCSTSPGGAWWAMLLALALAARRQRAKTWRSTSRR